MNRAHESKGAENMFLGQILSNLGFLTPEQVNQGLEMQKDIQPRPLLGTLFLTQKVINEEQLAHALAAQLGVELWDLEDRPPEPVVRDLIPSSLAQNCKIIPQAHVNGYLRCVSAGPVPLEDRRKLEFIANKPIRFAVAPESAIMRQLHSFYGISVENMIAGLSQSDTDGDDSQEVFIHDLREMAEEPTLVNLVNVIISSAVSERASDIHIEPFECEVKVKYRIDGLLQEMPPPPKQFQAAVISRIKIMAGMDIAERYVPQDGQIRVNMADRKVDIRVSTVPTIYGESVVMRLLNKDESLLNLASLGMETATRGRFEKLLRCPYGIMLVCGPTGSGKSTTLYCSILNIFTPEKKIITIEDPVEYQINGINQIPVRPKRGMTFASGLRSILRQDPDIIMVGEIRDRETADISIRAALTGHLVFSTLHTNDAPGAVTRLIDMGVEPFLIASSLQGALGQRLVRRLCPDCRKPRLAYPGLREQFGVEQLPEVIYEAGGCEACHGRGYRGRLGIYELLTMSERIHDLILNAASATDVKTAVCEQMRTMRQDGWEKIVQGQTTVAEVLQATQMSGGE